jgi:hypothetical protein
MVAQIEHHSVTGQQAPHDLGQCPFVSVAVTGESVM